MEEEKNLVCSYDDTYFIHEVKKGDRVWDCFYEKQDGFRISGPGIMISGSGSNSVFDSVEKAEQVLELCISTFHAGQTRIRNNFRVLLGEFPIDKSGGWRTKRFGKEFLEKNKLSSK